MDYSSEYCACSVCYHITRLHGSISFAPPVPEAPFFGDIRVDEDTVAVDSCGDDEDGVCKCVGESKCGGNLETVTIINTKPNSTANPNIVFRNDNAHPHTSQTSQTIPITTSTKIPRNQKKKQQASSSSSCFQCLFGGGKDLVGRIVLWLWILVAVILLGKYMFGASKSVRVEQIAESIGGAQGVPGMPYFTADALRHMGKHAGWSDDQSFAEFDASHTDHLYETWKDFYDYHGMDHPNAYQGRRSR